MKQISSNATLFLRVFVPVFTLVFLGLFVLAIWFTPDDRLGVLQSASVRTGITAFYFLLALVFFFTVARLKRVEFDESGIFVSNYIKSYRYPWHDVESLRPRRPGWLPLVRITLKGKGSFGRRMVFLANRQRFRDFIEEHPGLSGLFI